MSLSPPPTSYSPSHPQSPSPDSSPPSRSLRLSPAELPIHTYHCLCSTLILATPYLLSSLPTRAPPAKDQARILPLPRFRNHSDRDDENRADEPETANPNPTLAGGATAGKKMKGAEAEPQTSSRTEQEYLPSLVLPALRPARKSTLVQREDGYERRRVWRCGRCSVAIGYEVENAESLKVTDGGNGDGEERVRVMFIFEDGLVETDDMLGTAAGKDSGAG